MIGFFIGASAVGVYSIAYQISVGIIVYVTAIRQTFFPELSKFIDENKKQKCANYVHTGLRYFLMIAIPTVGGMYLIGPDVISILTEGQGVPSPALIAVIALGIATRGVDEIFGVVMRAIEETYRRARILATGAIANIGINAVAIPALGIMGAALATVATYVLVSALTMARVNETVPTRLPWYTATRCLGATLLMIGVVELLGISSPPVIVVLCVPIYFGLLFVLRELTVGEVRSRLDLG
jgi:O-antigen/teichoic acid export membrane protein